jgi:hypothetical protein
MLHKKLLILLFGSLLGAAGAWADDVGYVDCSGHPEETQVFTKPRRSQDVVTKLPCGERFRVVLYGFIFSKVQTSDGKVGFILSSLISLDRVGGVPQQWEATRAVPPANAPATPEAVAQPTPAPSAQTDSTAKPVMPAPPDQPVSAPPVNVRPVNAQPTSAQPVAVVSALAPAKPASSMLEPASMSTETATSENVVEPTSTAAPQPKPAPEEAATPVAATPAATAGLAPPSREASPTSLQPAQPNPARSSQPRPVTAALRPAAMSEPIERTSWEKPNPVGRSTSLLELFGGYSFERVNSGGTSTNFNGALGSFGLNLRPWLQIIGDTSYSTVTVSGTKNTLYGNHFGPRFFFRRPNRWGMMPFAEFLIGGSRADTSINGVSGYSTSENCISYKAGGGVDIRAGRHFEFRAIDAGYYRTSFGTNLHQNNYYVSTGFVVRLFGGGRGY